MSDYPATSIQHCHVGTWERMRFRAGTLPQRYGLKARRYSKTLMGTGMRDARVWLEYKQLKAAPVMILRALWRVPDGRMYMPKIDWLLYRTDANGTVINQCYCDPTDELYDRVLHEVNSILRRTWFRARCDYPYTPFIAYRDWHSANSVPGVPANLSTSESFIEWIGRGDDWLGVWF